MTWPPLVAGEVRITDRAESLRRQIHPNWLRNGVIGSDAFKPSDGRVSTTMDSVLSPLQAHERFPGPTVGSCALTVAEVDDCELRAVNDSACAGIQFGHAYIDLRAHGRSARDRIAKRLKQLTTANGIWLPSVASDSEAWNG